ncbi:hypothetical protein M514_04317 [Trichuris suis]|uniref:Peptidase S1 domain-containing protein n=1 Tax=Trichuris suis TaxID=68888 RepID=A0A085MX48_9BILA|nr:hypothetical protein M513_04317 [Trichuris suis]KFD61794.1 hypothetical protein M514_04317 [Trichuris suis]
MFLSIYVCTSVFLLLVNKIECLECGIGVPTGDVSPEKAATLFLGRHDKAPMFPWNVIIVDTAFYFDTFSCLGTLIPSKATNMSDLILTTANCFWSKLHRFYIAAGFYKVLAGFSHDMQKGTVSVQAENDVIRRDFAVLKTKLPIPYSQKVSPICLPEAHETSGAIVDKRCFVSEIQHNLFRTNWEMKRSMIRVFSPEMCSKLVGDKYSSDFDYCSIGMEKRRSTRLGASLVCLKDFRWVMYGVHMNVLYTRKISNLYEVDLFSQVNPILSELPETNSSVIADESCPNQYRNSDAYIKELPYNLCAASDLSESKGTGGSSVAQELDKLPTVQTIPNRRISEISHLDFTNTTSLEESKEITISGMEISLNNVFKPDVKVFHGTTITPAPWSVIIMDNDYIRPTAVCSGSLLKTSSSNQSNVVLTAAQCVYTGLTYRYSVGAVKFTDPLSPIDITERKIEKRDIAAIRFKPFMRVHDHCLLAMGIAILKLKRPYTFKPTRLPVSINEEEVGTDELEDCYVTGATKRGDIIQANVKLLHPDQCREVLENEFSDKKELCSLSRKGFPEVSRGSPLVCRRGNEWYQYGTFMMSSTRARLDEIVHQKHLEDFQVSIYLKLLPHRAFIHKQFK